MPWIHGPKILSKAGFLVTKVHSGSDMLFQGHNCQESLSTQLGKYIVSDSEAFEYINGLDRLNDKKAKKLNERTGLMIEEVGLYDGLGEKEVSKLLNDIDSILFDKSEWLSSLKHMLIKQIIPLKLKDGSQRRRSAGSYFNIKGSVLFHVPVDYDLVYLTEMAIDLCHELGHQLLFIYQSVDKIMISDENQKFYSGVRQIDRNAFQTIHAAMALSYMILACDVMLENAINPEQVKLLQSEKKESKASLAETLESLEKHSEFTELGTEIIKDMKDILNK
tara:strand:- start:134992 stop:135825 length:834 start_codon:yes stop_codon:yes gene_type:complete